MGLKTLRRAAVLAVACLLATAAIAFADTIPADGDQVAHGNQGFVYLGEHAPGAVVTTAVAFSLTCATLNHADAGQTIGLELSSITVPLNGTATATSTTIGPVPTSWTVDGEGCPFPAPTLAANGLSNVTLTTPTTPGNGYIYTLMYARLGGNGGLNGVTAISFEVDVVANTPPILSLPGPMTAEATSPAGAIVTFAAGGADAEDDPDPTPVCSPASGAAFPMGTTTVACSVTDSGGLSASGSFGLTVVDTTAPILGLPADLTAEATSASGASVRFSTSASDVVDGAVTVACDHGSGSTFPLGTTTVTCSATDTAGNPVSGSFNVTVVDSAAPTLSGVPADFSVTTNNPAGTAVTYIVPTATDAADPNPSVVCPPASGSSFAVGPTPVTCTATDATGNSMSAGFTVTVAFVPDVPDVPDVAWSVRWGEPVDGSPAGLVTNTSRTVPLKVRIFADGVEQTTGSASVRIVACGGDTALVIPLTWGSGRWGGHLDVSRLAPGCYVAMATLNGNNAGSFALDVRGADATKLPASTTKTTTSVTSTTSTAPSTTAPKDAKATEKAKAHKADKR